MTGSSSPAASQSVTMSKVGLSDHPGRRSGWSGMPVSYEIETLMLRLQRHPVEGAVIVDEVHEPGRAAERTRSLTLETNQRAKR